MSLAIRTLWWVGAAGLFYLTSVPIQAQPVAQFPSVEPQPESRPEPKPVNAIGAAGAAGAAGTAAPVPATTPSPAIPAAAPVAAGRSYGDLPEPEAASAEQKRKSDIREADANVDRVVLMPTAETHPEGRLYFSAHELIFWQLGYAISDRVQATVTTWPVIVENQPFFIDGSVKANLYRSDLARFAVAGGVTYVADSLRGANDTASVGRLAAVGQLCISRGCWSSLVGGLGGWIPLSEGEGSLYTAGVGLTAKLSKYVGLLLEIDTAAVYDQELRLADGALVGYGVRFSGSNVGVDLTMLKPFVEDADDLVMGVPWISFTYRSDPLTQ